MIYRLRRKFILITSLSLLTVFSLILGVMAMVNRINLNRSADELTDAISIGGGKFPDFFGDKKPGSDVPPPMNGHPASITEESRFSTRYFTVWYDTDGSLLAVNTDAVRAVDATAAVAAADRVKGGSTRGWYGNYRYKIFPVNGGTAVTFVDASASRTQGHRFFLSALLILGGSGGIVLLLTVILSRRAILPVAESYRKQKQFITDASHELKTPLTLILTDTDIAESELGKSEWLDDIRTEGARMTDLVGQMVTLSRMDEETPRLNMTTFSLSETTLDTLSEFSPLAEAKGKTITADIAPDILVTGDEGAIRRLLSILLDNAVKYADPSGHITVTLSGRRRAVLKVENDFASAATVEIDRLFDRFYRADKARTAGSGYGIGLSIAQATVTAHHGEISAYRPDDTHIGFRVILREARTGT